ncbi:MAG: hypothetical protein IJ724_01940 [Muribaculaceae bacterium]|nr:hypothetical protein [Muribaculaceae bacterium]MBR1725405.1 hypothetical protein [Muribaculaceae bacterium]
MKLYLKSAIMTLVMTLCVGLQALGQNAYAVQSGNDAEQGGVNVTHHKEWYDQFEYNWPIGTNAHTSKITDKATDPDQIIALLRYITWSAGFRASTMPATAQIPTM